MMQIEKEEIEIALKVHSSRRFQVVWNSELTVLTLEDRLFVYNQTKRTAYELIPEPTVGLLIEELF